MHVENVAGPLIPARNHVIIVDCGLSNLVVLCAVYL